MSIRKVSFSALVFILFITGVFVTSTLIGDAAAPPIFHESDIHVFQSPNLQLTNHAGKPAYDSGWQALGVRVDQISVEFTHNLGGNPGGYFVSLECQEPMLGTYNCTDQSIKVNSLWYDLTSTTIKVWVRTQQPESVRVCIWHTHSVYLPTLIKAFQAP
jgi:hypothetical protein